MRSRILWVGRFSGFGGAERLLKPLADDLVEHGWQVELLLTRCPEEANFFSSLGHHARIPPVGASRTWWIQEFWRIVPSFDLVICASELTPTFITFILSRLRNRPFIAQVQANLSNYFEHHRSPVLKMLAQFLYRRMPRIHAVSRGVADDLRDRFGVREDAIRVIYNAIEIADIERRSREPVKNAQDAEFATGALICIARLEAQKRLDVALSALSKMKCASTRLVIIGDGSLRPQVERLIADLGLQGRVRLVGHQNNPFAWLRLGSALLLTSDFEGFGRVLVEAMALGVPVVSTDCPSGPSELLADGRYGVLVPCGEPRMIAAALDELLSEDSTCRRLSLAGRERAREFDQSVIAPQFREFVTDSRGEGAAS